MLACRVRRGERREEGEVQEEAFSRRRWPSLRGSVGVSSRSGAGGQDGAEVPGFAWVELKERLRLEDR